jgi:hypothetical protein
MFIIESSEMRKAPAAASLGAIGRGYHHTVTTRVTGSGAMLLAGTLG